MTTKATKKKLAIGLLLIAALAVIATNDRLPVKSWLSANLESFAIRYADKLPLSYFGEKLFDKHCATCHDNPAMQAPTREALAQMSKESVMIAMGFGKMQPMAAHLSKKEQGLIAHFLDSSPSNQYEWLEASRCTVAIERDAEVLVGRWGMGLENRRFLPGSASGINPDNVSGLELAWSLALPKVADMRSQPAIIGNTLYLGDKAGQLYAVDRSTGCIHNSTKFISGIRSAITVAELSDGSRLLVFADSLATVYAVDPLSLKTIWQTRVAINPYSIVTGSISYYDDRLYVPISAYEVAAAGNASHECCKSHGAVVSLKAGDGRRLWQWDATADAEPQELSGGGRQTWGPSGASVWTTPTIDVSRNMLYVGTGENLSHPATSTSDAIVALDLDTGDERWVFQALRGDVWNAACLIGGDNCPENPGPDFDFGASVVLATLDSGKQLLLAGQKSGEVFSLDPDNEGAVLWRKQIGQGSSNGGIHWGMALSGNTLFVPMADPERDRPGYVAKPGLYAVNISDGSLLWSAPSKRRCEFDYSEKPLIGLQSTRSVATQTLQEQYECSFYYGNSAAALATEGLVFSATLDGTVRAYSAIDGTVLWQARTAVSFEGSNSVAGHGGAIDVAGQVAADGWLYVLSGYSMFGQLPGNMLLAYRVSDPGSR
jgi:polyvinyl alcohol dehydrogenase (cytochrome)